MADAERKLKDQASQYLREGDLEEALRLYERAYEADPSELRVRLRMGDIHRRLGDSEAAVSCYEEVAERYAEDGLLLKAIGVNKVILQLDARHTRTQARLADLNARRRKRSEEAKLPVTLRGLGIAPPPDGVMVVPGVTVSQQAPEALVAGSIQALWPEANPGASLAPGSLIEDSVLDITVGDLQLEEGEAMEDTVKRPVADALEAAAVTEDLGDHTRPQAPAQQAPLVRQMIADRPNLSEDIDVEIPLLSDLPRNAFIQLLERMRAFEVGPGAVIIEEGQVGGSFFILVSGRVRVSRLGMDGEPLVLAYLDDGAFFGEMALLQDGQRTASVTAEEDCELFEISQEVLDEIIQAYPSVAKVLRNFFRKRMLSTAMATHPIFTPFAVHERRALIAQFKSKSFRRGDVLLEQDKKGAGLFILLYGNLEVQRKEAERPPIVLATLSAGEMFGEMSLLTGQPTFATVVAATDCFVLRMSKRKFDEVIMTHPQVLELVGSISEERRAINDALLGAERSLTGGAVLV